MKWIAYIAFTFFIVILFTAIFLPHGKLKLSKKAALNNHIMTISSSAFRNNDRMPSKYTCDGQNINPPLEFIGVPKDAKSLVLLVEDPDAPGGTYHHWSVYNMAPSTTGIEENSEPTTGTEGMTDFGKAGYGGPCPPSGVHHYHFTLYALDTQLELPDKATFNEIKTSMENHILSQTELVGVYSRVN